MTATVSSIVIGQRVHCILYGGKDGTVVRGYGSPGTVPVRPLSNGAVVTGGSAEFDIVWDDGSSSRRIPEALILGSVQWKVFLSEVSQEEVAKAIAKAAIYDAEMKAKAEAVAKEFKAAMAAAEIEGRKIGLIPEAEFRTMGKRGSAAAFNLRTELKAAGIKARVVQDGYNCLNVSIAQKDRDATRAIMGKYKAGRFDGMTDCYDYDPSAWGKVFGDVDYVFDRIVEG